jgi:translation initiation factor eIF-2B subunit gamma
MTLQVEFQAVVLAAGKGSRMPEITSGKPKCLLPVGTKPLVWYPLYKLQQSGFTDVILVVLENHKSDVQNALDKTDLEIKIDYFTINGKEDFDTFRMHDASVTSLFFHQQPGDNLTVPGPKSKHKPERDLVGIDTQTNRLVFLASASDFEGELALPRSLLKKHTHIKLYSNLIDSHIYVLKNWVIKYLNSQPNFSTIKGELLPHIVKKQLSKPPKKPEGKSVASKCDSEDIFNYAKEDDYSVEIREASSYSDHSGDLKPIYHGDSIRCYAVLASKDYIGVRLNTLPTYWAINNTVNEKWDSITSGLTLVLKHPKTENKSSQVDDKCVIWEGAKLQEKTSFKNSTIGANTEICSFSRVFNSIIMNNVTIKEKFAWFQVVLCR